jgi:2-methylcitrate dehydratase PrpD
MTNAASSASAKIADFALAFRPDDMTPEQFRQTARALIDTVAVAIGGRNEPAATIALDYVCGSTGRLSAGAWGTGIRLPVESAALYNGVAGHVLDFDDVTSPLRGHPSIALLPPLVALAEATGKDGRQLAAAFAVGFEVLCKLAKAMVADHYAKGWHSTSSVGTIAASVACAHLLQLDRAQIIGAIGLAVAQTAGTRANFGTMAKSFQAGHCGAAAVRAALLAQRGFTGAEGALDGEFGYTTLYANGEDVHAQLDALGRAPLEIDSSGFEIKKYPLCYATHRAIDGMLDMRAEHGLTLDRVERVDIVANHRALAPLLHDRPQTGLEAKFSMQYAVAAALQDGYVKLSSFEDAAVQRPAIQQFFAQVGATEEQGPAMPRWTRISIRLRDGRTLQKLVTQLRGAADCPLSDAELLEKVEDCFAYGRLDASASDFAQAAFRMDRIGIDEILARLEPNETNRQQDRPSSRAAH